MRVIALLLLVALSYAAEYGPLDWSSSSTTDGRIYNIVLQKGSSDVSLDDDAREKLTDDNYNSGKNMGRLGIFDAYWSVEVPEKPSGGDYSSYTATEIELVFKTECDNSIDPQITVDGNIISSSDITVTGPDTELTLKITVTAVCDYVHIYKLYIFVYILYT